MGEWISVLKSLPEKTGLYLVKQNFFHKIVEGTVFYVVGSGWYTYADVVVEWSLPEYREKEVKVKKYKGNKKYNDICKSMQDKGMQVDATEFDKGGDFVNFKGVWHDLPLTIVFNTFNGQFMAFNGITGERLATHLSTTLTEKSGMAI